MGARGAGSGPGCSRSGGERRAARCGRGRRAAWEAIFTLQVSPPRGAGERAGRRRPPRALHSGGPEEPGDSAGRSGRAGRQRPPRNSPANSSSLLGCDLGKVGGLGFCRQPLAGGGSGLGQIHSGINPPLPPTPPTTTT